MPLSTVGPYILGQFRTSPLTRQLVNPRNGKPLQLVYEATAEHVQEALQGARSALPTWQADGPQRRDALMALADALARSKTDMAELEMLQTGKPRSDALYEMDDTIECIRYFAGFADKGTGQSMTTQTHHSWTVREPFGVVGLVTSFNYPLMLAGWKLGPALAAGNCAILKPAPQTPLTSLALAELATGLLPPGVLSVLPGDATVGNAILEGVSMASFTGSTAAGQAIMERQAKRLTPLVLECGGKNPAIVLDDADVKEAAYHVAQGAFSNAGQNCCAVSRLLVQTGVYASFMEALQEETQKWRSVEEEENQGEYHYGPLIDQAQYNRVRSHLSKSSPAFTAPLPRESHSSGYYVPPSVYVHVHDEAPMATEEIFGPVLAVLEPFSDVSTAIQRANQSPYGLAAGVFSRDYRKAQRIASQLQTGYVWINAYNTMPPYAPFGGRKLSGIGNDLGKASLDQFTFVKSVFAGLS